MSVQEWEIVITVATAAVLALGPWMCMVHAKLAVIANQVAELSEKLQRAADTGQQLWLLAARHDTRLEAQELQIEHLRDSIRP